MLASGAPLAPRLGDRRQRPQHSNGYVRASTDAHSCFSPGCHRARAHPFVARAREGQASGHSSLPLRRPCRRPWHIAAARLAILRAGRKRRVAGEENLAEKPQQQQQQPKTYRKQGRGRFILVNFRLIFDLLGKWTLLSPGLPSRQIWAGGVQQDARSRGCFGLPRGRDSADLRANRFEFRGARNRPAGYNAGAAHGRARLPGR